MDPKLSEFGERLPEDSEYEITNEPNSFVLPLMTGVYKDTFELW